MSAVLLDTHVWVWSFGWPERLSARAAAAIEAADSVYVSPFSLYEIGQKVRIGKWPEMGPHLSSLTSVLGRQGGSWAVMDAEVCLAASMMSWLHRDPFDRLIAATALARRLDLVSADEAFDQVVKRIW